METSVVTIEHIFPLRSSPMLREISVVVSRLAGLFMDSTIDEDFGGYF